MLRHAKKNPPKNGAEELPINTSSLQHVNLPTNHKRSLTIPKMAPKQQRIQVQKADPRRAQPKGYFSSAYNTVTSPENSSVVRSIAVFGVCFPLSRV
jgi:hypothetical protein